MTPAVAWSALNAALEDNAPPCDGRALFTADRLSEEERALCASICASCPVLDLCNAYAVASGPTFGFWAGHAYSLGGKQ
ncbi:WhiB family transcriptional regulator [Agrococcus sp. ProA11]|uniref:WhiB family transcriptional regulator n=1 Tax=Agrococcus chionoecetis TaxID=3153752 RepID=UPI003260A6F0